MNKRKTPENFEQTKATLKIFELDRVDFAWVPSGLVS